MSIAPLSKVTFIGLEEDKDRVLTDLQGLGCVHVIPLRSEETPSGAGGPTSEAREALKFLLSYAHPRKQVMNPQRFDPVAVERRALELQREIQDLEDERDFLTKRISNLEPWGDFPFPALEEMDSQRFWFYIVPHYEMGKVEETGYVWEVVNHDHMFYYIIVVSRNQPTEMPVERVRTGNKSLSQLRDRLEEVEVRLDDLQAERGKLTRYIRLYVANLNRLEDDESRRRVACETYDSSPVFALQGWAPNERIPGLEAYSEERGIVFEARGPARDEQPPTLMRTPKSLDVGQDLVRFYMTPSYWLWDPSTAVFVSFSVFFAMILADAGYGVLLGFVVLYLWRKMGRSEAGRKVRILFASLAASSILYGILIGSYFGLEPSEGSLLGGLRIFDLNDANSMMAFSILVGIGHIIYANLMDAWRQRTSAGALVPLGWVAILVGGSLWGVAAVAGEEAARLGSTGIALAATGALAVFLFSARGGGILKRIMMGLLGLTRLTSAFGDVMSYLRLFALGLASGALAMAFNDLSSQISRSGGGVELFLALLILLFGHGINIILGISSGFIHGLRLNLIEFFNWGVAEEGTQFSAFAKKEDGGWNQ